MTKRLTNTQAVKNIMEHSEHGALAQLFVMDALQKASSTMANLTAEELEALDWTNGFVSKEAWHSVAKEIKSKLDTHFQQ